MSLLHTEQSSEGPSLNPGGITGSVSGKRGAKRKLDVKPLETKYEAIMEVERGSKTKKQIAEQFNIPSCTLSSWLKKRDQIKTTFLAGDIGPNRKKVRSAKFPEVEAALLTWFMSFKHTCTMYNRVNLTPDWICQTPLMSNYFPRSLGI